MNTPKTNSVVHYLRSRTDFSKTDHQVWREHSEDLENQLRLANKRIEAYETQLGSAMPPDFKDWHENTTERPTVAKLLIENLRHRLQLFEEHVKAKPMEPPPVITDKTMSTFSSDEATLSQWLNEHTASRGALASIKAGNRTGRWWMGHLRTWSLANTPGATEALNCAERLFGQSDPKS